MSERTRGIPAVSEHIKRRSMYHARFDIIAGEDCRYDCREAQDHLRDQEAGPDQCAGEGYRRAGSAVEGAEGIGGKSAMPGMGSLWFPFLIGRGAGGGMRGARPVRLRVHPRGRERPLPGQSRIFPVTRHRLKCPASRRRCAELIPDAALVMIHTMC